VRIEVLAVGKELLIGKTLNTNAHWIGRRLALMGTMIKQMATVDDDLVEISRALASALSRNTDFLVVMGGLGPTPDDMTLEGIAKGAGRRLAPCAEALSLIKEHYARRGMAGIELTPARTKMAMLPKGSTPLPNNVGTAPGVRMEVGGAVVFCLPGVPLEMRSIFRRSVEPELMKNVGKLNRAAVTLWFEGVYESAIAPMIQRELRRNPGTYIKSHPRGLREGVSRIELDIVTVRRSKTDAERVTGGIAREMIDAITKAGGVMKSAEGLK